MMRFRAAEGIRILDIPIAGGQSPVGALCREVLDRLLIASEHQLRLVLAEYLRYHSAARPTPVPLAISRPLKRTPGHRRSASPSTGSAENKSSADSHECHVAA